MLRELEGIRAMTITPENITTLGPAKHAAIPVIEAIRTLLFPEDGDG